ncbi:MAG: MAPEG family protein [Nitrosomonadales bacterium]|jgi:uncharacterized membrane protein YecN with MAPEG domain
MIITGLYASLLFFLYFKLTRNVISLRRKHNIALGDGKNNLLEMAIRAHGNFIEYVPIGLILLGALELNKMNKLIVFVLGAFFLAGRIYHAASLQKEINIEFRIRGMKLTLYSLATMAGLNILLFFVRI